MLNEISQRQETNTMLSHLYVDSKKKKKKENKNTKPKFIDRESRLVIARDGVGVGDKKWAKGVKRYKLQVINKSWEYNGQHGGYC